MEKQDHMHGHAEDWLEVSQSVAVANTTKTLSHTAKTLSHPGLVLVLKHAPGEGKDVELMDSSKHIQVHEGENYYVS